MSIKHAIAAILHPVRDGLFQWGTALLPKDRRNPHRVYKDPKHLDDVYRRVFTSSYQAAALYQQMLMSDPYFEKLFREKEGRYVVRVAVVAEELVANIYQLGYFRTSAPLDPYNDNWDKEGVANLFVHRKLSEGTEPEMITSSMVVTRHIGVDPELDYFGDMKYDFYEPLESYSRLLTNEELQQLAPVCRINRPAMERYYAEQEHQVKAEKERLKLVWKKA